jgi:hypothetical protein
MKLNVIDPKATPDGVEALEALQRFASINIQRQLETLLEMAGDYPAVYAYAKSLEDQVAELQQVIDEAQAAAAQAVQA